MSGVAYAAGRLSHNPSLRDAGLGCAAAHPASAGLREIIYLGISRARPHDTPSAMVARGGRPDLAGTALPLVVAPTLLLVGGRDDVVITLNEACARPDAR